MKRIFSIFLPRLPINRLAFIGLLTTEPDYDQVVKSSDDLDEEPKTGVDGLRRVFLPGKYGELSAEFTTLIHMSSASIFLGAGFGALRQARTTFLNFIETNDATKFQNHLEAKRQLQHRVTLAMGTGAAKWGYRIGMFSTIFLTTSTAVAAWRGEDGVLEYVIAGMTAGGLFKVNMGVKGFIAGSLIGAFVGSITGLFFDGLFWISGTSMKSLQETQKKIAELREDGMRKQRDEYLNKEYGEVRNIVIGQENKSEGT
ncbi:GSCOCG00002372001-RA-CDS [Cotesia congregata]|uniref:Complex I assembly factor TIMMDC1, mitochondrial n=1 Tax=Cotesia congregata TaxID=51543 RepID=A0A8J2MXJ5_COTCN|nr:GSCOCG00002372001-RA-CDS [Cotesia congregata]CAG5103619.1 Similar to 140up: RPII140-upstream gene protein (Drosophila melanogaster) [Cotesia congregata]